MNDRVFRSDDGQYLTQSLFLECSYEDTSKVLYTLKNRDYEYKGIKYPSLHRLYMEIGDPTEYQVATTLFEGWAHWQKILGSPRIMPAIQAARDELEVKLRSQGIKKMMQLANGERASETAAKWLSDKGWEKSGMGRPTREKVAREAKKLAQIQSEVMDDAKRLSGN